MHLPIKLAKSGKETVDTNALIDCGAGGIFIDQKYAEKIGAMTTRLRKFITAKNVDGTINKNRIIKKSTTMNMLANRKTMKTRFLVTNLEKETVILGLPWL